MNKTASLRRYVIAAGVRARTKLHTSSTPAPLLRAQTKPVRYHRKVATELHLEPDLAAAVHAAQERARESGELPRGTFPPLEPTIPPEAATVIAGWLRDGGYDAAIGQIAAEDPDLANQ